MFAWCLSRRSHIFLEFFINLVSLWELITEAVMRKSTAFFGSSVFIAAFIMLYLALVAMNSSVLTGTFKKDGDKIELAALEEKLRQLEKDLHQNHKVIKDLKNVIHDIVRESPTHMEKLKQINKDVEERLVTLYRANRSMVALSARDCTFAETPPTKTDVQILDVYEILKFDNPDGGAWKQGWDITYDEKQWKEHKLKVFVVPHSHNDPGWLKTFEKYYLDQTQHILNNMLEKLSVDERRKFIWAEISFFSLWWEKLSDQKREKVMKLLINNQLEIVTGGWVMTDEASVHYYAMIDQMIEGHQWMENNLGVKSQSGWAIDPFGMSPTMAYMLKRMGLTSMLVQRVHYSVKKHLGRLKNLEFMWRQIWDHEGSTDMFCHMMPFYSYDVPHTCGPDPKVCCQFDFKRLPGGKVSCPWRIAPVPINENNVAERAQILLDQYRKKSQLFRNNVVLIPLGDDFRYDKIIEWDQQFNNYQLLFDHMNSREEWNVEAQFGTLTDYFNAIYERSKVTPGDNPAGYPILTGDFFTYSDRDDHYWSGFYTSRPFYKNLDRVVEAALRSAEIAFTLSLTHSRQLKLSHFPVQKLMSLIVNARRNLALFQHHDGITGTSKDLVVIDYANRLLQSLLNMKMVLSESVHLLMMATRESYSPVENFDFFLLDEKRAKQNFLPEKEVIKLERKPRVVVFFNSLAQQRREIVFLFVSTPYVEVKDSEGFIIPSQTNPVWTSKEDIHDSTFEIVFVVSVPALGLSRYTIRKVTLEEGVNSMNIYPKIELHNPILTRENVILKGPFQIDLGGSEEFFTIQNAFLKVTMSSYTGMMQSIMTLMDGKTIKSQVQFLRYGTREGKTDKSGAYLFLPNGDGIPIEMKKPLMRVLKGAIVSEVHSFHSHTLHIVRIRNSPGVDSLSVEINNIVELKREPNIELAMRIHTNVSNSDREFFTDLNGFQIIKRKTFDKLPLQANFYPIPTVAYLEDASTRFSMLTQQALGVSSLKTGWLEVMLDRRLMQDDNRGLLQGVQDNVKTMSMFRILVESRSARVAPVSGIKTPGGYLSLISHGSILTMLHPVNILPLNEAYEMVPLINSYSPLLKDLPCDIHMLNLRTQQQADNQEGTFLPRDTTALLLHRLGFDCRYPPIGMNCSLTGGQLAVKEIFKTISISRIQEMSLTLLFIKKELNLSDTLDIPSMEITAYKTRFE